MRTPKYLDTFANDLNERRSCESLLIQMVSKKNLKLATVVELRDMEHMEIE